ncbi:DNA translocase FtsK [Halobacillus halophilus]|uniref:DNA translocase SftA n=1 Tax=Halobacillus halophilus (strain ATCC 35676 / DSM 2266 / JCM 20832 / KCTC 3685 / LMG 17431 / NBRC 102448 / NCIMB 2269) TaxID=866895 RepID=I0JPU1_HALH3|nr:DNA translocase FtsK [Halobacillus halophilus]ASF40191.1 DNA translocase FtsK [Halobacillus halophilus]CCG46161.1 DNA translocase SftA [Halobacillus halophilus DSM 2266]
MWNDIKNKFKQWFDDEEETPKEIKEQQQPKRQERQEMNAKTKMTYRYPKQGEFRFPVIPDQSSTSHEKTDSSRRPERSRRSQSLKQTEKQDQHKEVESTDKQTKKQQDQSEKQELPETSTVPFTPTDVPSPIYGYHNRQLTAGIEKIENTVETKFPGDSFTNDEEAWQDLRRRLRSKVTETKDIQQKPENTIESSVEKEEKVSQEEDRNSASGESGQSSFLQTLSASEGNTIESKKKEFEPEEAAATIELEELEAETEINSQDTPTDEYSSGFQLIDSGEAAENNEAPQMQEQTERKPEEESEVSHDRAVNHEGKLRSEPKENPNGGEKKKSLPFNVIMTPRDKRTRDQKKQGRTESGENHSVSVSVQTPTIEGEKENNQENTPDSPRKEYNTPLHLLEDTKKPTGEDEDWTAQQMELLETTLRHFHVRAKVVNAMKGPTVTRFEVQPEPGVKVSKITNLADDIKLSMAARDIRIEAPIPGKQAVGIEVPNPKAQMVGLQQIFESEAFHKDPSPLSVGLGLDIGGSPIVTNLKKMPHGLIAGATGSGKSVCINTILISLLYKAHHEDVKFLLIDPKMVELAPYNDLPHLVSPVITDVKAATSALKWAVKEMEERYEKFVQEGVRDVERYNDKMVKQNRRGEKLPYLVIVIDELADLMMVSPQDVEDAICRIAQKARACGIHLLLATQRPSVDVITGLIKANIPTRIAFSVSSQVDSRTIIDSGGAEKLLGKGDMLFVENGSGQPLRIQGAFLSDEEIERVTNYVKKIAPPQYLFHQEELMKQISNEEETDALFSEAVQFVMEQNGASASLIQRRFKVGYNRAARLIDQMEEYGIISEQKGSKPRDVLLTHQQVEEMLS